MEVDLGMKFASKKILYWAANEKNTNSPIIIDAKKAYGDFKNSGVIKTNDKGKAIFKFKCPQLYKAKRSDQPKPITFFRHLHFVVENNGEWLPQIYTKIVVCNKSYKESMKIYDSGTFSGQFFYDSGTISRRFWYDYGTILKRFWDDSGTISGRLLYDFWTILGRFWDASGTISGRF